ncbi:hypothetical protein BJY52DRAFT_1249989 [Lactarius psammicola]|nr:hypothetical protein BJY52DRAFT_1249989 [Lactarius psammicola]
MNGASATPPRRHNDLPTSFATRPLASSSTMASSQTSQQIPLEAMLSAHAGAENPALSALEQSLSERNLLSSQNTQLWKLIEKSRGLYSESQKNLERVRMERDAYKARLLALGESPDAVARGYKEREKQLKPSSSSNGMRQGSDKLSSQGSGSARPARHQSADTGTWPCIRADLSFCLLSSQWLGLGADSHTLTPQWQPTSRAPPIVTVSHSSLDALDVSITPTVPSLSHTRQQPATRPLNVSKVDDRPGADRGSSSPTSQSTSPSVNFPPNSVLASGLSTASPLETMASSSQSGIPFLTRPQAASRESRITLPDEAKQYISSVMDSPANSHRVLERDRSHSRGQSPARSSAHNVPNSRDSATDKSSTRRDLSDGEFLDLDDSDSLYDSAADHSLTSPSQDSRSPDDIQQPRLAVLPPAADDFPLPPGMVNASNGDPNLGTPQAIPAIQRTRKADGPDSPTTPTPIAFGSRSSVMSVYQSVIPEQDSQVQFRALPLLPHDLPYTRVTVTNSSIRPNDRGKDVLSFVVMVDPGNQKEPYLIEKLYSDVLGLDQRIRSRYGKSIHKKIPHLPDGKLWRDHAPSRVDQRKFLALIGLPVKNNDEIIAFLTSDVIKETNKPVAREGYKEGYLTKRGKNFGGWKTRFFVLQGPQLEYYESRGGQHLGTIAVTGAQIGRQHRPADRRESDEEGEYRHAFLIIEPKKTTGGSHRHVFGLYVNTSTTTSTPSNQPRSSTSSTAPADLSSPYRDRRQGQRAMSKDDINVSSAVPLSQLPPDPLNAKLFQATPQYEDAPSNSSKGVNIPPGSEQPTPVFTDAQTAKRLLDKGQSSSSTSSAESPLSSSLPTSSPLDTVGGDFAPSIGPRANSELGHYPDLVDPRGNHGGRNPQPSPEHPRQRQGRRTSLHPTSESALPSESPSPGDRSASPEGISQSAPRAEMPAKVKISGPMNGTPIPPGHKFGAKEPAVETAQSDRRDKVKSRMFQWGWRQQGEKPITPVHVHRAVFGVTLEESLEIAEIAGLPAIVFRCIQYLEKMEADQEEGIYRLSGSSAVIKSLKDKFNTEGDVDLLRTDEYWDPHAVAGLLKSFFRELPSSILTRDLHMRFLSVMDLVDPQERITELSHLIAILPVANYSLLRALTAHLISIVQNANVNKMTMRNVGIVFSPTLGIPAGVFSLMLAEFNRVFNVDDDASQAEHAVDEKGDAVPGPDESDGAVISHRNSKHYLDATTDELLGLSGRKLTDPDEEGQSDDAEELSTNTESGADTTDQDMMAESSAGNQSSSSSQPTQPSAEHTPSSRSRVSNVAAARGLGIRVASSDGPRHNLTAGLPVSPRPLPRSPKTAVHPQDVATSSSLAPTQQQR